MTIEELLVLLNQRRDLLEQHTRELADETGVWSSEWNENYGRWSEIVMLIDVIGGLDADTFLRFGIKGE